MGNKEVKTLHMDQLGSDGVIFDNHYVTTSICMASRATVMTGLARVPPRLQLRNGEAFRL